MLAKQRRLALVGIVILVAVITPAAIPSACSRWPGPCTCSTKAPSSSVASASVANARKRTRRSAPVTDQTPLQPHRRPFDLDHSNEMPSTTSTPERRWLWRAHRCGQDGGGRARHRPGAEQRDQGVLHSPDQGAVQPEVPRSSWRRSAPSGSGILTGDTSINGEAPVVVMTTEVLRNMLYAARGRCAASSTSSSTRFTTSKTPIGARSGRK